MLCMLCSPYMSCMLCTLFMLSMSCMSCILPHDPSFRTPLSGAVAVALPRLRPRAAQAADPPFRIRPREDALFARLCSGRGAPIVRIRPSAGGLPSQQRGPREQSAPSQLDVKGVPDFGGCIHTNSNNVNHTTSNANSKQL